MDAFDSLLDWELARVLDPIVSTPAPPRLRGWRDGRRGRLRTLHGGLAESVSDSTPVQETVPAVASATVSVPSPAP